MKTIALDAHSANCSFAIFSENGQLAQRKECPTSAQNLISVIESVRGRRCLIVEESHMAAWVKRTVERFVDRVIICDPVQNSWIAKANFNDDASSAQKLGQLLRGGFIKEIHHPDEEGAQLRRLFLHYHDLGQELTCFKNKLKAVFRGEAIATNGRGIYEEEQHDAWLEQLRGQPHLAHEARHLFELVDCLDKLKQETHAQMTKQARKQRAYACLESIPGAGPVVAAGYLALLETPHRFARKNQVWSYAGLGQSRHVSDEVVYRNRASKGGNRALKWLVFVHFHGAVTQARKSNRFKRKYDELRQRGLSCSVARRHVSRTLLSVVWNLWKKEELYRDEP